MSDMDYYFIKLFIGVYFAEKALSADSVLEYCCYLTLIPIYTYLKYYDYIP